ncbi:toll-like receptor 8 [Erpetoichthys calabaricus]|uniref:toll-like receptor 8 n=1 Tax=Erpetoichthys calabaricus TaxID=27687 RepID=UPI0010A0260C|nr:toll-like receptor 8 [Erpetoichthys calabaricus]
METVLICYHKAFFLIFLWLTSGLSSPPWVSKTVPCDVTVGKNGTKIDYDCKYRRLESVPNITWNATSLDLSKNKIEKLAKWSFYNFKNLTYLNLGWNKYLSRIENETFLSLTNLKKLILDGNTLSEIPYGLPAGLTSFNIEFNGIKAVFKKSFTHLSRIVLISLNKNCYYRNDCTSSLKIENGTFSGLKKLQTLFLNYNNLKTVPQNLPPSLTKLFLASNKIENISQHDFANLSNLHVLDLSGNCPRCSNTPFPCEACSTPDKSINIDPKAFENLSHLKSLYLSGNSLRTLHPSWFQNCTNLKYLFLSFNYLVNEIENGDFFSVLPRVEMIDFSYNYFEKHYYKNLSLSDNFAKLQSLKSLHIEGYVVQSVSKSDLLPLSKLKNLTLINLGTNFLKHVDFEAFHQFNLSLIYLSENRLVPETQKNDTNYSKRNESMEAPLLKRIKRSLKRHKDKNYHFQKLPIKKECLAYGPTLDLSRNNIFFISPEQFKSFENIACLNLSNNGIGDALNGTEFVHFTNLKYLDISFNKIDLVYEYAFSELKKLEVLDLSHNFHYFEVPGVIHRLTFLRHLPNLKVLNLSENHIFMLTDKHLVSSSVKELQFKGNLLRVLWSHNSEYFAIFRNLYSLKHLDISYNKIKKIPVEFLGNLSTTLNTLVLDNNELRTFEWDQFKHLKNLEVLSLRFNKLVSVADMLSIASLLKLDLSNNKISRLSDDFLKDARSLSYLYLDSNKFTSLNRSVFQPGFVTSLKVLSLKRNPFHCTCENLDFFLWVYKTDIEIPRLASDVTCGKPKDHLGMSIVAFDQHSCADECLSEMLFVIFSLTIVVVVSSAITKHLFYWDAWYIFHYIKATLKGYRSLNCEENYYDAFIAYDTNDPLVVDWVLNHLRVELEDHGNKACSLCLEQRDWQPGVPIIDNLSQSILHSRKTVFVLTNKYIKSGVFKTAFYLAHQRLIDENKDVIVLILLEPVLQSSQFLRLRKRLCKKSILKWPESPPAEVYFWHCLRKVIRVDNKTLYNKLYSCHFSSQ